MSFNLYDELAKSVLGSVVSAICGGALTWIIRRAIKPDIRVLDWFISRNRRKALEGCWRGKFKQAEPPQSASGEYDVTIHLKAGRFRLTGHGRVNYSVAGKVEERDFKFSGALIHQRFVDLDFQDVDKSSVHFGNAIVELSAGGSQMSGYFSGFGLYTEQVVHGALEIQRVMQAP